MKTIKRKSYINKSQALRNVSYYMGRASAGDPTAPLIIKVLKKALDGSLKVTEAFYDRFWMPESTYCDFNQCWIPLREKYGAGYSACAYFNFNNPAIFRSVIPRGEYKMSTTTPIGSRRRTNIYLKGDSINLDAPDEAWHALNLHSPKECVAMENEKVQVLKEGFNKLVDKHIEEHKALTSDDFLDGVLSLPTSKRVYDDSEGSSSTIDICNYARCGQKDLSTAVRIKEVGCASLDSLTLYSYVNTYAVYEVSKDFINIKDRWGNYWVNPFVLEE